MQFNQKDLGQIFLNQTFLNVLIKTFPKRYDTCRGLFFRPRIPSGAGWPRRDGGMKTDEMQTNKESQVLVANTTAVSHRCQY